MHIIDEIKTRLTPPYTIDPDSKRVLERSLRIFEEIERTNRNADTISTMAAETMEAMEDIL